MQPSLGQLKYPIGKFSKPVSVSPVDISKWINEIATLPGWLRKEVEPLSNSQLDTPYRPEGWTVRQVVHHLPDSHVNGYIRFKLALTEDNPAIKPYMEDRWAELPEAKTAPVKISLDLLDTIHQRWVLMLRSLTPEQWKRTFYHPERKRENRLDEVLAMYAWHGKHHLAHITELKKRMGW
ncbi:MAG TPA: bacillithiol transferase BstA [Chitinophagales bacterium]|nr:bacillithiol transferase BstA [Chitinophagales bacterium]